MTDIVVGQSYYLRFDPKLWQALQPYAPLGSLIAAACLRETGRTVAVFDAMLAESESEWAQALDRESPRYAVLFEDNFNYLSKMCLTRMREAAFRMIAAARERRMTVVVCGSDASDHAAEYLEQGADFVIRGEGEAALLELLDTLEASDSGPPDAVEGLTFSDPETELPRETASRPVISDLDALPFPAWDLVDVDRYREIWNARHGYFSMNMATTRGCPYHCNWCAKPIWGQTYKMRSPANVADELEWLKRSYRPDHIWFADDIMGLKRGWMAELAVEIERRDAQVPFKCLSRVDLLLRKGEIDALSRAGCQTVWVGAESGSQAVLDAMDKGTRVGQIHDASRRLREAGLRVGFFLQFGYPGEDRADIERTLQIVRDCRPDEIGISVSYPLPGTRFHDMVARELGEKQNWVDSADLDLLYNGTFQPDFYRQLGRVVQKEFRLHKAGSDVRDLRLNALRPRHLRRLAAWAYHAGTLPWERHRLERLTDTPDDAIRPLASGMTHEEAAEPTAQREA